MMGLENRLIDLMLDLHTHTVVSGHAYSTLKENIEAARAKGLKGFAVTDHGPAMPGVLGDAYHVVNMKLAVPKVMEDIRIIRGFEANIIDYEGKTDLPTEFSPSVEFIIASLHEICIVPSSREENTAGVINAMASGYVDAIGHPDGFKFPLDYLAITEAAYEYGIALEVNNNSLKGEVRGDTRHNYLELLRLAKKNRVYVAAGSDSHFYVSIGELDMARDILEEVDYPKELIINSSVESFDEFIRLRGNERKIL
ncbi:MAG: phosphatase [Fusobacteria bacterium]|nr:phosphatase [Fusobacteriota bacterium]